MRVPALMNRVPPLLRIDETAWHGVRLAASWRAASQVVGAPASP
jgi:hypothetical protein